MSGGVEDRGDDHGVRILQFDENLENEKWKENGEKIHGSDD